MALLQLTTDAGSMSVSAINGQGFHIQGADGQPVPTSCVVSAAEPSATGAITLSPTKSAYTVKPTAAVQLSLDAAAIGPVARFQLLLDFNDGVQSVTFPDNFKWNGNAPEITSKGIHVIDTIYMNVDGNDALVGNYTGLVKKPIDMNKGLVVYLNDEFQEDLYVTGTVTGRQIFTSSYDPDDDPANWVAYDIWVKSDVTLEALSVINNDADFDDPTTLHVAGGSIYELLLSFYGTAYITDGYVGTLHAAYDYKDETCNIIRMSGGTVAQLEPNTAEKNYMSGGHVNLLKITGTYIRAGFAQDFLFSGGTIDSAALTVGDDGAVRYAQSGGYCGRITMSMGGDYTTSEDYIVVTVSGGTVGDIVASNWSISTPDSRYSATLSDCTVNSISFSVLYTTFDSDGEDHIVSVDLNLVSNVDCAKLDITAVEDSLPPSPKVFTIGPGCTVGLSTNTQRAVELGAISFTVDPTATIINLED